MMRFVLVTLLLVLLFNCKEKVSETRQEPQSLSYGTYRAVLEVQVDEELPFTFQVFSNGLIRIYNAKEVITVNEISYINDSIKIQMPVFEGYIKAGFEGRNLRGHFIKESLDRVVPFFAEYNNVNRFIGEAEPLHNVTGTWETVFSPDSESDRYVAKGIFEQNRQKVKGTFRTTTGDYRYLEGAVFNDTLKLSTFDGAHAFLITAKVTDSTMEGTFYSGNHFKESFVAKRNTNYVLPDANDLTFLKEGYNGLSFSFPDVDGQMVSLSDERFKDKVVVVQVMGTWCPNCLDESKYYTEFYKANKNKDVEFVALAFEYAKTMEKAFEKIQRLTDKLVIDYPVLLAQYGTSDKAKAQEKLPMLNHVLSYPTSIFIDKQGKVRKIHTGFNGPATGQKYEDFKTEFESFVEALLAE